MRLWLKLTPFIMAGILGVVGVLTLSGGDAEAGGALATARLRDPAGTTLGAVRMSALGDGKIQVRVQVRGLTPGFHGFHIHTIGTCTAPDFTSAGGHFNPTVAVHPGHAGDQPVILVNADGSGAGRFVTDRYALGDLFDADGSALVVHAAADNYGNVPIRYTATGAPSPGPDAATLLTGDAGARSLCGAITQV
jgi:Cu-Zn family superoxide dismutase